MAGVYTVPGFGPSDLLTSPKEGARRVKVSVEPSLAEATREGRSYTISGTYSVAAGDYLALNVFFASEVIVHSISTNAIFRISAYNQHATGSPDGIFAGANLNLTSVDETPSYGQLYYVAAAAGSVISAGTPEIGAQIIADENSTLSAVTKNITAETQDITITMTFEEVGARAAPFGLTASTLLEATTEMSTYG
jgi:hypothetical protein